MIPSCVCYFECFEGNYLRPAAQVCIGCSACLLPSKLPLTAVGDHGEGDHTTQLLRAVHGNLPESGFRPFSQMCLGDYVFLRNGYKMQKLGPGFKHLQVWVFSRLAKGFYLDCISALAKYINLQLLGFFAVPVLGPSELSHNRCMEGYQRKSAHHKFWVNRRRYSSRNIHLTSWIHVKKV